MAWQDVDLQHLFRAMDICDERGSVAMREEMNFSPAKNRHMYYSNANHTRGPYEARVLIALAHRLMFPDEPRLVPDSYRGTQPQSFLVSMGFESRPID